MTKQKKKKTYVKVLNVNSFCLSAVVPKTKRFNNYKCYVSTRHNRIIRCMRREKVSTMKNKTIKTFERTWNSRVIRVFLSRRIMVTLKSQFSRYICAPVNKRAPNEFLLATYETVIIIINRKLWYYDEYLK
jgi:hypothetical protein